MARYLRVFLPKSNCYTSGGRGTAQYHFYGFVNEMCDEPDCGDCPELRVMFAELCQESPQYHREWDKLHARYARVPQRVRLRAEYHRKRK